MTDAAVILEAVRRLERRIDELAAPQPHAVKRAQAAKLMGVSRRKLEQLIREKRIHTAADAHLVPMSEVRRYCAPKTKRVRRPSVGHRVRKASDGQSDEAIAEMKRALRGAR